MGQLQELRKINAKNIGRRLLSNETVIGIGTELERKKPFDADNKYRMSPISIPDELRTSHLGCFGTTRIGKTKLIEYFVTQDIAKGYNVVVVDPKGDSELYTRILQVCAEYGRLGDLMMLTPIFPQYSMRINPLQFFALQDELVDTVISGIRSKEDYYIAIAQSVTQAVVQGLLVHRKHCNETAPINLNDIREHADRASLEDFRNQLESIAQANDLIKEMNQILSAPSDFFAKVSSSLLTMLKSLTTGNIGTIIGRTRENEFLSRIESGKGVVLYCNTGSLLARRTSHIVARVMVSSIQGLIGRWLSTGKKLNPPICLHLDEGHNIMYKGVQELFNKCGGGNVWVHLYTQSIAQIVDEVGDDTAKSILDNINTWIYMLVNHPDTAKYVEKAAPEVQHYEPTFRFDGGVMLRGDSVPMIKAQDLLSLQKRQFFMRHYGKFYFGHTVNMEPTWLNVEWPEINQGELASLPRMIDVDSATEEYVDSKIADGLGEMGHLNQYAA